MNNVLYLIITKIGTFLCPVLEHSLGLDHVLRVKAKESWTVDEWLKLSDEQRNMIEDAALNMGLTVPKLRERLECFASSKIVIDKIKSLAMGERSIRSKQMIFDRTSQAHYNEGI